MRDPRLTLKALLVAPLLWAIPGLGADAPQAQSYLELEEVLVQGRKPVNNAKQMTAWLSRLVGEFRYEGHVERRGERAEVQGGSQCSNLGAPGVVQCTMNLTWQERRGPDGEEIPGGSSSMTPAVAVYGIYLEPGPGPGQIPDPRYIGHVQVDSRGLAETGKGQLFDDTLIYKSPCADLPGNCVRVVQIEAPPDGKVVRMSVDVQRDSKTEVHYVLQWNRVPPTESVNPGPALAARVDDAIVPAETQTWLRKLVGQFRLEHATQACFLDPSPTSQCTTDRSSRTECLGIGTGSGVRCIRDMGWLESIVPASRRKPVFELWGYDPVARNIVHTWSSPMVMDKVGGVAFYAGKLDRNRLTYMTPCYGDPACLTTRVTIPPGGRHVDFVGDIGKGGLLGTIGQRLVRIENEPADLPVRNPSPMRPR